MFEKKFLHLTKWQALRIVCFFGLIFFQVYLLVISRTGGSVLTPWQAIDPRYIYCFFGSITILGLLLLNSLPVRWFLALIIIQGLVAHAYLPLSHELLYGADGWRHIGNVASLLEHGSLTTAVIEGSPQSFIQSLNLGVLSYAEFWGILLLLKVITPFSLVTIVAWLVPILWSVFFPLLLYFLAKELGLSDRVRRFLVWLSFLPFALMINGSFSLPVSFGFLLWLGGSLAHLQYSRTRERRALVYFILLTLVVTFGYSLFAILLWLQIGGLWIFNRFQERRSGQPLHGSFFYLVTLGFTILFPTIELVSGYAHFNFELNWFSQLKQLVGNFTAVYLAAGPRPHDIATGNIIFNQVPANAFVANLFTSSRWWLVIFMLFFWTGVCLGIRRLRRSVMPIHQFLGSFTLGLLGSYCVSRYFLVGEQVLTRRLDSVLALLLLLIFVYGLLLIPERLPVKKYTTLLVIVVVVFFSAAISASYSLGPDLRAVDTDTYEAMKIVTAEEKNVAKPCVIADTYALLALEALSARQIIGGGFPIDQYFGQKELYDALTQLEQYPEKGWPVGVWEATGADHCFVVLSNPSEKVKEFFAQEGVQGQLFGGFGYRFPTVEVWRYARGINSDPLP